MAAKKTTTTKKVTTAKKITVKKPGLPKKTKKITNKEFECFMSYSKYGFKCEFEGLNKAKPEVLVEYEKFKDADPEFFNLAVGCLNSYLDNLKKVIDYLDSKGV